MKPNLRKLNFKQARTCYHHLAGSFATDWFLWLQTKGWLHLPEGLPRDYHHHPSVTFSDSGEQYFSRLGYRGTLIATACLDGTERLPHLSGAMGKAFLQFLLDKRWIEKNAHGPRDRSLTVRYDFRKF